jgi:hypothetical protein
MKQAIFPQLSNWESTKQSLHAYSKIISAIPRTHHEAHPKWWHISLRVRPTGLISCPISTPLGDTIQILMDLRHHQIILSDDSENEHIIPMNACKTANEMAERLFHATEKYDLAMEYDASIFDNSGPREYVPQKAELFLDGLLEADLVLKKHRGNLRGDVSPVQFWPHNFDLSFEWYGNRKIDGGEKQSRSQINFGWAPGGKNPAYPYFYSNPYPFENEMTNHPLPEGAQWFMDQWNGSIMPYDEIAGHAGHEKVLDYFERVFEVVSPQFA